jgi:hypothetical protein
MALTLTSTTEMVFTTSDRARLTATLIEVRSLFLFYPSSQSPIQQSDLV